jgi:hypothetical protein
MLVITMKGTSENCEAVLYMGEWHWRRVQPNSTYDVVSTGVS